MRALHALIISLLLLSVLPLAPPAEGLVQPLRIQLEGPRSIALGNDTAFTIVLSGGPAEGILNGEWSYLATLSAEDWSGSPSVSPKNDSGYDPEFEIVVHAPSKEQTLTLTIDATSTLGVDIKSTTTKFELEVVKPYVVKTQVRNTGAIEARELNVSFFVDDVEVETKQIDLPAGTSTNVTFIWTTYTSGKHVISIRLDPDSDIVELDNGDNVKEMTVYIGVDDHPYRLLYLVVVFGMLLALIGITYWAKKNKKLFV